MPKRLQKKATAKSKSKVKKTELVTIYPQVAKKVPVALAKQLHEAYEHGRRDALQESARTQPDQPAPADAITVTIAIRPDNREMHVGLLAGQLPPSPGIYAEALESAATVLRTHGFPKEALKAAQGTH